MPKKEEYEKTKISPLIFAVLLIIILLMFAIGKKIDKNQIVQSDENITSTTTTQKVETEIASGTQ